VRIRCNDRAVENRAAFDPLHKVEPSENPQQTAA
jgi:hypothetical protein